MNIKFEIGLKDMIIGALALIFVLYCLFQFASIRAEMKVAEVIRAVKIHDQILGQIVKSERPAIPQGQAPEKK